MHSALYPCPAKQKLILSATGNGTTQQCLSGCHKETSFVSLCIAKPNLVSSNLTKMWWLLIANKPPKPLFTCHFRAKAIPPKGNQPWICRQ